MSRIIKKQHTQHSARFIKKLNSVNSNKLIAFRNFDEIWLIGKYKGTSLNNTPTSYIRWAIDNMNLSETSICILKNHLNI
jgi:hypothetical protein